MGSHKIDCYISALSASDLDDYSANEKPGKGFLFQKEIKPSEVAAQAAMSSLKRAGISLDQVEFLISCTQTPDYNNPSLAQCILARLNKIGIGGLEIKQSAAGSIYALQLGAALIKSGKYNCILVCATEFLARAFSEMSQAAFQNAKIVAAKEVASDASAAFLLTNRKTAVKGFKISSSATYCQGDGIEAFYTPNPSSSQFPVRLTADDVEQGKHLPHFDSNAFLSYSQKHIPATFRNFVASNKINLEKVVYVVQHSPRENLWQDLNLAPDIELHDTFSTHGYTSAAGIPLGMKLASKLVEPPTGSLVLLFAAGSGLNWGFSLLEKY